MGLYEVPLSMSVLVLGMVTMLTHFHMCGIMLLVRAVLNMICLQVYHFYTIALDLFPYKMVPYVYVFCSVMMHRVID